MTYFVYILQSVKTGRWYIGSTQDVQKRLNEHNRGRCKSSKPFAPYKVVYTEIFETRSEAMKRELQIKKSGRIRKKIKEHIDTAPSSSG